MSKHSRSVFAGVFVVLAGTLLLWNLPRWGTRRSNEESPRYVGGAVCARCHAPEYEAWRNSHHDLALDSARLETVLGNFDDVELTYFGITSSFHERDGAFFVRTEDADGVLQEYPVTYTIGVDPLQQYLVEFVDGRYQVLPFAWDTRQPEDGGQRWFHLYPDEEARPGHPLFWTNPNQTWNHQCAECHSTDFKKNYEPTLGQYQSSWSEIDVSCEACHGPGSIHVAIETGSGRLAEQSSLKKSGLIADVSGSPPGGWSWSAGAEKPVQSLASPPSSQVETCAFCHSRRGILAEGHLPGQALAYTHRPALLEEGLYFSDGQIQDEVYVYGSFRQSKMYQAGVVCSDCHDPHSLELRLPGDQVCGQCHTPTVYAVPEHHFHPAGSEGASCLNCHMPARTYMVIDPRRDHSFQIPRPDLSQDTGAPNACTQCHAGQTDDWAAQAVARWYGPERRSEPHFGQVFAHARAGGPGGDTLLAEIALDPSQDGIIRATAFQLLGQYASPAVSSVFQSGLKDPDPLVRFGAVLGSASKESRDRFLSLHTLLNDSVPLVRLEVARALADAPERIMFAHQKATLDLAIQDYIRAQYTTADQPESHLNVGALHLSRGRIAEADTAFQHALKVDSTFVPAYVNLADLRRIQGIDRVGEALLRKALSFQPNNGAAQHALGLLLVRLGRSEEAFFYLKGAARAAPENARYSYVWGIALNSAGRSEEALQALEEALRNRHPYDPDILGALVTISRDVGDLNGAIHYAERLFELRSDDPNVQALLHSLRSEAR